MSSPERMCLGCRARRAQNELVRLQLREGWVVPARGSAHGRGAYLCPQRACFEAALRRRAFTRAFRAPVRIDEGLWQAIEARGSELGRERR